MCNCDKRKVVIFRVDYPDGTSKPFLTEEEARKAKQKVDGAHWRRVEV
ncbi:hypothetical protein SEA_LILBEANIE_17 [Gordonia phage Lilbeanie]|uniref:Uncharacterized protein n=1 Tax=Gordonia phage Lilbeanie TaxID=2794947 RepID=A0A7T1NXJ6_9CAUD|nr:hypothetical protein J1773_gp17 [Gordonia phage Lilbeanie]QPO17095.1 hypothetical protein SEA_LILBEANIE_17 [Gordonia phage Lilbeanie]